MTVKEEATGLVEQYRRMFYGKNSIPAKKKAIKCALIAVKKTVDEIKSIEFNYGLNFETTLIPYWKEVEQELLKM